MSQTWLRNEANKQTNIKLIGKEWRLHESVYLAFIGANYVKTLVPEAGITGKDN